MDNSIFEMFSKMLMGGFGQNNMSGGQNNSQASTSGQNNSNPAFDYYPGDIHNAQKKIKEKQVKIIKTTTFSTIKILITKT